MTGLEADLATPAGERLWVAVQIEQYTVIRRFNALNSVKVENADSELAARRISGVFDANDPQHPNSTRAVSESLNSSCSVQFAPLELNEQNCAVRLESSTRPTPGRG